MPTISDKVKRALASIEQVRKDLNAVDENHAAVETISRVLDGRRNELAETEQHLVRLKEQIRTADAEHTKWQAVSSKARAQGNADLDRLNAELQAVNKELAERREESDSVLQGIRSLKQRLKV
jgi:archaellum component FlaC